MMKKIILSLTLTFLVGLTINVEKVQHEIENLNFEIGMFVASAFADPPTDPEDCEEGCESGGLCNVTLNCPSGSDFGFVSCFGLDRCESFFDHGVVCDGILSTC